MTTEEDTVAAGTGAQVAVASFDGDPVVQQAVRAGDAAAHAAGVSVCEVTSLEDLEAVVRLYATIWGGASSPSVPLELLRAFAKAGNYVGGAFDGEDLVGACVGFFTTPAERALHSHIAGVSRQALGRKVGFALKVHQRGWSLQRGLTEISWTFDPLVCRNAHFNLVKLAARADEYLPNFYGTLTDTINRADDTDRLLVRWHLRDPDVAAACAGVNTPAVAEAHLAAGAVVALGVSNTGEPEPGRLDGRVSLVAVPPDVEAIRQTRRDLARQWRVAVRETLTALTAGHAHITGFDRAGWYIVHRDGSTPTARPTG
ncbi:MAG: GNAT family N-acetyltransferase [Nocardioidaceae bacterium]